MIGWRDAMALLGGVFLVLGLAAAFVVDSVPRAEAAACRGQMVRASYYGAESGSRTASGIPFDGTQWLVAHRSLPFGTKLRLTYHGKSVVVPVLDRGPFIKGRTLDLSRVVAVALGTIKAADGAPFVCMERVG